VNSSSRRLKLFSRAVSKATLAEARCSYVHFVDLCTDIALPLDPDVLESLCLESAFPERPPAACDWTRSWTLREDSVDAGLAHPVIAFGVDFEPHVGVQVAGGFAYWADICVSRILVSCEI